MKKIILTEAQENNLVSILLNESKTFPVEPTKVLLVKKYLDKNFKRGGIDNIGDNGYVKTTPIVAMLDNNGGVVKNMTDEQLFNLLIDNFQNLYPNNIQINKFILQVMKDWFNKKITDEGLLSTNLY